MSILAAIAVFCLLILSHEFGHFSMARLVGVRVYDFSLGMGPKIFSIKGPETEYTLRLFPIGGHCLMAGEDEASDDPRAFNKKKVWQRMLVIAGGPAMNFICAIVIFVVLFMMMGTASASSQVGELIPGQAAEVAGMLPGDVIVDINGQPVNAWADISGAVGTCPPGQDMPITVLRGGESITLSLQPYEEPETGRRLIGIYPAVEKLGFFKAIAMGVEQSFLFTKMIIMALVGIVAGTVEPDVAGPVGVVNIIGQASSMGIQSLLLITAMLCVNLAVVNLLPIPALDGARLVFLAVEGVRGKPLNPEREGMVHFIGLVLLFGLIIVITINDIIRLIG